MKGSGNQIEIPMMLKMRWTRAIWIAFFFCVIIEARKAVQVVPICAPSVRGSMSSTMMIWSATGGTSAEVVMEFDCTQIVITMPKKIERYGLNPRIFLVYLTYFTSPPSSAFISPEESTR